MPVILEVIWARESDLYLCYGCLGLGWKLSNPHNFGYGQLVTRSNYWNTLITWTTILIIFSYLIQLYVEHAALQVFLVIPIKLLSSNNFGHWKAFLPPTIIQYISHENQTVPMVTTCGDGCCCISICCPIATPPPVCRVAPRSVTMAACCTRQPDWSIWETPWAPSVDLRPPLPFGRQRPSNLSCPSLSFLRRFLNHSCTWPLWCRVHCTETVSKLHCSHLQ